ncbi:LAME_0G10682g1_1 [Lachancea meyersii CBS 8951]|uniref:LAME_0G10682g1_1 n=1 Tax=Lachancea meyersii CBS 8951 TaxID=1266667 RepID=A0A1G4K907_9SACH|nr:LAME_0G10682g1_1 [Lachancea meyersii CBS 8951]
MKKYTVAYGLIPPQCANIHESHILPITKIIQSESNSQLLLTCGRDGTVIRHTQKNGEWHRLRMQTNSDWVSDMAELDKGRFIVVSHDFSLCLLTVTQDGQEWNSKIVGYHDDYVKCVAVLEKDEAGDWTFATCGLDMKVKIWTLGADGSSALLHTIDNAQPGETGSLYALTSVCNDARFDLVAGDNNGNLVLMSSKTGERLGEVESAHKTNIKLLRSLNNGTRILSTSSDGMVNLWDVEKLGIDGGSKALIYSWKWAAPVWCIQGTTLERLLLGDSRGVITQVSMTEGEWESMKLSTVVSSDEDTKGILAMLEMDNGSIWFSFSGDSNLHTLDLKTGESTVLEGGDALLKSSLLTNRRHVITQNTRGIVQRWDIVSCELLDTFDATMGTFDDLVHKLSTKEILSHWCSVSIKTGKLFVKLSPKFMSTEVYGSALEHYKIVNDIDVEIDERYNLGRIAVNSILNEFISWVILKDETFRKELVAKKSSVPGSPSQALADSSVSEVSRPGLKENRRLSLFTKLSKTNRQSPTPTSLPSTPLAVENSSTLVEDSFVLPPPATSHLDNQSTLGGKADSIPTPVLAKRSASSGSLLAQKLKLISAIDSNSGSNFSVDNDSSAGGEKPPMRTSSQPTTADEEPLKSNLFINHQKGERQEESTMTEKHEESRQEYLSDFIVELRENYTKETDANASSFKILGKKAPSSKITREDQSPIIEIKAGVLLLVNCWNEGSSGDTVCFSTYLPTSRYDNAEDLKTCNNQHVFEALERNLPYWIAKALFKDEKTTKDYPKLTFVLKPWENPDSQQSSETSISSEPSHSGHHHHLPFHRSKHRERDGDRKSKTLPKVAEAYTKLHAPNFIKVKKILNYVVDRFDSKTPEMRCHTPVSEWLEILCKNQLLDNEMALGSVKTLYWKSQGDIVLEYRRKSASLPVNEKPE